MLNPQVLRQRLVATELLFEAVNEPARMRASLYAMTVLLGADVGALAVSNRHSGSTRQLLTTAAPDEKPAMHTLAFFDPYRRAVLSRAPGHMYPNDELIPASEIERTPFFNNWLSSSGIGTGCVGYVEIGAGDVCSVGFGRLGAREHARPFDPCALEAVQHLLPHLERVYRVTQQTESLRAVSAAAMNRYERYHVGLIVVDGEGRVLYRNSAAQELLDRDEGLMLRNTHLDTGEPQEAEALMRTIRAVIEGELPDSSFSPDLFKVSRPGAASLSLAISPYRGSAVPGAAHTRGHAVIMIYDPDRPAIQRQQVIETTFDLSARESELACAIAAGESLESFAERTGRTLESVRSQLKRIYKKTGTTRQTELVKLVLSGPAAMVQ